MGILLGIDLGLLRNVKCIDWKVKDVLKELLASDRHEDIFREAGSALKKRVEDRCGVLDSVEDGRVRDFLAGLASGVVSCWAMEPLELQGCINICHE
jgi:hypothetical protein